MQCRAIGVQSHTQCKRHTARGNEFCKAHLLAMGLIRPKPLPENERITLPEILAEMGGCKVVKKKPVSRHISKSEFGESPDDYLTICGKHLALRCRGTSRHSGKRCKKAAMKGRNFCRNHGGRCCGPKTASGKMRSGFQIQHGRQTVAKRAHRSQKHRELQVLKRIIQEHGL